MIMALGMFVFSLKTAPYQDYNAKPIGATPATTASAPLPRGNSWAVGMTQSPSPASSSPNWPALLSASTRYA